MNVSSTARLINRFLCESGIRVDCIRLQTACRNHPMPHSIRMVSDVLDGFNIRNIVCRIGLKQLHEVPVPSLLFLKESNDLFYIFKGLDGNGNIMLETCNRKKITLVPDYFRTIWDGIVLMVEPDGGKKASARLLYALRQTLWWISRKSLWTVGVLAIFLAGFLVLYHAGDTCNKTVMAVYLMSALTGTYISTATIVKSYSASRFLNRFCQVNGHDGCRDVLESDGADILGWISLGELSFSYFLSTAVWLLAFPGEAIQFMPVCYGLSMVAVLYSVVWQMRHRKMCTLCIAIDAVLVLTFLFSLYISFGSGATLRESLYAFICFSICFTMVTLSVRFVCEKIKDSPQCSVCKDRNEKVLASSDLLWLLLEHTPETFETKELDIMDTISCPSKDSPHNLTVVMNLKCIHCAKLFSIFRDLEGYNKNIILLTDGRDDDAGKAAAGIIDIATKGPGSNWDSACDAIQDWYVSGIKPQRAESGAAKEVLDKHRSFCTRYRIRYTPEIFIDGKALPDIYTATDIQFIL